MLAKLTPRIYHPRLDLRLYFFSLSNRSQHDLRDIAKSGHTIGTDSLIDASKLGTKFNK